MKDFTDEFFESVENDSPLLFGHIFYKLHYKIFKTPKDLFNWINSTNKSNNFAPIKMGRLNEIRKIYKHKFVKNLDSHLFRVVCEKRHITSEAASTSSSGQKRSSSPQATTSTTTSTNTSGTQTLIKNNQIYKMYNDTLAKLQVANEKLRSANLKLKKQEKIIKKKKKLNKRNSRRVFYTTILSGGCSLTKLAKIIGNLKKSIDCDVAEFSDRTVRRMAWELGFIADYITCRAVLQVESVTLLFDATTQEGLHINCVILCTQNLSYLVSLEHLPGGTASDYKQHICNSIKRLVEAYCQVSGETFDDCLRCLVGKICCTLTDRAPVNHATVRLLEEEWGKKMVEMNCNLHPLEAASRATKKILFQMETEEEKNIIPGGECLAWKIILSLNQLRFSPRKGDIMDFANFWQQKGVKKSDIPRLHGNRLNIIFHLGGIYYTHFQEIKKFIKKYKCPNDLQLNLQRAMEPQTAAVELRVMGAIGKLLTGPWMQVFYTTENCNHSAHTYMSIIKNVFNNIRICIQQPEFIFHYRHDLFGQPLNKEDNEITKNVLMAPGDAIFLDKFKACLEQISIAIGNQYSKTFETVAQNSDEVMSSTREHTMVAESIIGEFCAHKKTAPNASVDTICNLIKSKRNGVLEFINDASKSLYCRLLDLALPYGRNACTEAIEKRKATSAEIQAREERRRSENEAKYRRRLQNTLKNLSNYSTDTLQQALPNTSTDRLISLQGILLRTPESRSIEHYWEVDGVLEKYYGKIRRNLLEDYVIFYYKLDEYEVGVEENIPVVELAADFLCEDMSFC